MQPFRKKKRPEADIKCCSIVFSYSLLCYSKVTSDFIPLNWIKIVKIQKFVPKQDILSKFGGHFEKKRHLTDIKCSSLVFSYSLLWYSIAPSNYISLNWMKIVEIQKKYYQKQDICWHLAAILKKKRPHGFIQHWDFCRQPDFNSPMAKVSKNSGLQKSLGGCRVSVTGP